MKCRDCQHFDSPEFPPKRAIGACELELEPMPPDAPACDEFALSPLGHERQVKEWNDSKWEEADV